MKTKPFISRLPRLIGVPLVHLEVRYRAYRNRKLIDDVIKRMRTQFAPMNIERPPADE